MNKTKSWTGMLLLLVLFTAAIALFFGVVSPAAAQTNDVAQPAITSTTPTWLADLVTKFPWLLYVMTVMTVARLVFKPLFSLLHRAAEEAGWKWFDNWADKAETSKVFATICYVLDWGASVKLVKK